MPAVENRLDSRIPVAQIQALDIAPELIPVDGPLQYVTAIPVLGPWLKRRVALAVLSKYKFVALPNMISDEAIQPELRGNVMPECIANESLKLLEAPNEREHIRSRLEATMPKPGAAMRLATEVIARLKLEVESPAFSELIKS